MAGSPATTVLVVTAFLFVIILTLFGWRMYERVKRRRFRWDDYSITPATLLSLVEWSLVIAATTYGLGNNTISSLQYSRLHAHHLLFASELLWIPATALVRISVIFALLQLKQGRPWRITLSLLIAAQVVFCIIDLVFLVVQCIPLAYIWSEPVDRDAVCTASSAVLAGQYAHAGVGTATDLVLALAPLTFAQAGLVPTREGILAIILVALGLLATTCSILRITLLKTSAASSDVRQDAMRITFWSLLEVQSALIAANIASFKSVPPPPPRSSHHYPSGRRRRRNPKSRGTSSLSRTDSYQLPSLSISLTQSNKHNLGLDTNVSSLTGSSTLKRSRSEDIIWPRECNVEGSDEDGHESPFHQIIAAGGILMTTELDVRSEILSRGGSSDGERVSRENARREEWAIADDGEGVRGDWSAV
ncbi:integral membrane protein [Paraphaeosphaeria sporulosa]